MKIMKIQINPKYYFELMYNRLLDVLNLTPNFIVDKYLYMYNKNRDYIIDLYNENMINEVQIINNLRWNIFYKRWEK